ncbi:hypothetical protein NE237_002837 [Protea cynaroides]|uniref:Nucleolar complex protein 2 homolog n=1 Tax=Protea cynaroides TaxID=273540 RepID=A0A9Q0KFK5_9MAGN|nr:hypothetical protein NE237_002837 [Protea cynaroides]
MVQQDIAVTWDGFLSWLRIWVLSELGFDCGYRYLSYCKMGKLGKKARKFAKKNLQSVLKRKRKMKPMFKRKKSSRDKGDTSEDQVGSITDLSKGRSSEGEAFGDASLDAIFSGYDSDTMEDASDSDGYLSEDASCPCVVEREHENYSEDVGDSAFLGHNKEIHQELAKQKKKLDSLRKKDPEFSKFLESHIEDLELFSREETDSDVEGEKNYKGNQETCESSKGKVFTSSTIDIWCQLVMEQNSTSALPNLLNAYRTACHYGTDSLEAELPWRIQKSETFCKILTFMLCEADGIFRRLLGISSANSKKDSILELMNTTKRKTARPLIKSYLRNTLFLLTQVTNSEILGFVITRLGASIIFFPAFPSLLWRLIKVSVHLWATGGSTLSQASFLIMHDIALLKCSDCFDACLAKAYKAFIAHCKFVDPANLQHIQFLGDSLVKLCSVDVQKSFSWALVTVQQLAKILQHSFKTKRKEALKKLSNWQYINCIDLWVKFISTNIRDHDIQPLLYLIIQVISGVAHLFPGPRYLPLRLKCVQMLNHLSISSGVFIPVSSLLLDCLEYGRTGKVDVRHGKAFSFSSVLKVPKQWFKSPKFQEECILAAIELLSAHFAQWSYHISFPELATIPLIRLRNFHGKTTAESLRRPVKRFIDQVEQNVEYVQKKRNEVAFSPKDAESVQSFLQLEKGSGNAPFTQYYMSIMKKSLSGRGLEPTISVQNQKKSRKKLVQTHEHAKDVTINSKALKNENVNSTIDGMPCESLVRNEDINILIIWDECSITTMVQAEDFYRSGAAQINCLKGILPSSNLSGSQFQATVFLCIISSVGMHQFWILDSSCPRDDNVFVLDGDFGDFAKENPSLTLVGKVLGSRPYRWKAFLKHFRLLGMLHMVLSGSIVIHGWDPLSPCPLLPPRVFDSEIKGITPTSRMLEFAKFVEFLSLESVGAALVPMSIPWLSSCSSGGTTLL